MKKASNIERSKEPCPNHDASCPYCDPDGYCFLSNPTRECDDYFAYYTEEEEDK